jgi:hypothetical protein
MVACGPEAPPVALARHNGFDVAWLPAFFDKQVASRPSSTASPCISCRASRPWTLNRHHA